MSEKDTITFLINRFIQVVDKNITFDYNEVVDSLRDELNLEVPKEPGDTLEHHGLKELMTLSNHFVHAPSLFDALERQGRYIKKITGSNTTCILTEKGEKLKDAGSVQKFIRNQKWADFISKAKDIITIFIFPILTLWFAGRESCNRSVEVKNQIHVIVDSLQHDTNTVKERRHMGLPEKFPQP